MSNFVGCSAAFSPTPSAALRYWNIARQRYCRRLARYRNTLRVSADPVAKPAADTRAESRGSRPSKADTGERRTVCWRGMDSNRQYRGDTTKAFEMAYVGFTGADPSRTGTDLKWFEPEAVHDH